MTGIDWFAAAGFAISVWMGYRLGVATERDRVRELDQLRADVAAHHGVVRLDQRRGAS